MKQIIRLLFLLCLFAGCQSGDGARAKLQKILNQYHFEMGEEHGLVLVDQKALEGETMLGKLAIGFYHYDEAKMQEARYLIHSSTEALLKKINQVSDLRKYFDHYPLTEKDLDIAISFIDPATYQRHRFSEIAHVVLFEGTIYYSAYEQKEEGIVPIHHETYISILK